jgi:hypothetical protein
LEKSNQKTSAPGGIWADVPIKPNRRLGSIGTAVLRPPSKGLFGSFSLEKERLALMSLEVIAP